MNQRLPGDSIRVQATPYYVRLASPTKCQLSYSKNYLTAKTRIGIGRTTDARSLENQNRPARRIIIIVIKIECFLVTDFVVSIAAIAPENALPGRIKSFRNQTNTNKRTNYIKHILKYVRVILSGGDLATLSNSRIEQVLSRCSGVSIMSK